MKTSSYQRKSSGRFHPIYVFMFLITLSALVSASVFVVSNTNDSGGGSLRSNIAGANASAGADTIIFSIPGTGPHTIQPLSQLPTISETLFIDGYSQTGAMPATEVSPANLKIEIDGTLAGASAIGIDLFSQFSVIRGLCINRFGSHGIQVASYDNNAIVGNYIGTDITGMMDYGNGGDGVYIYCADYTIIGFEGPQDRNIISGNGGGITVEGNSSVPVYGTLIRANYIGVGADGVTDLGNSGWGIDMVPYVRESTIGGEDDNHPNIIAFNHEGICIFGWTCFYNSILRNSIHSNSELGIDLDRNGVTLNDPGDGDSGGNEDQNFPVLSSAVRMGSQTKIAGIYNSEPNEDFRLEFFYNTEPDTSDYGEGEIWIAYMNITTDGSGNAAFSRSFNVPIPDSVWVTATATDSDGNTSEFSKQVFVSTLQVSILLPDLWLDWHHFPDASEYWIFGAPNQPDFGPDMEELTNRIDVIGSDQNFWGSPEGVGDPDHNMTYQVIAVDDMLQEIGRTNPAGEFDYGLQ